MFVPVIVVVAALVMGALMLFGLFGGRAEEVTPLMPPASLYSDSVLGYGVRDRDVPTIIRGRPRFATGPTPAAGDVAGAVTRAMNDGLSGSLSARFATAPGPSARPNYKVAVELSPRRGDAGALCALQPGEDEAFLIGAQDYLYANVAFCVGGAPLTGASARVKGITGLDDPAFRQLIGAVMREVFQTPESGR